MSARASSAPAAEAPAAPPATLTGCLKSLLAIFAKCSAGSLFLDARSWDGIGHEQQLLAQPECGALPAALLSLLEDRWCLRFSPATRATDGTPLSLAALAALWRPRVEFSAATHWKRRVREEDLVAIADALRAAPLAPAFILDGVEIAALWPLVEPLDLRRDAARAVTLQRRLAERLGADLAAGEDLSTLLPLPGSIVRQHGSPPPLASFAVVAPERRYSIPQLEEAFS